MLLLTATSFVERLLPLERDYFLWLNHQRSAFLDTFMYIYSDKFTWIFLGSLFLTILILKVQWKQVLLLIFCGVLLALLCDMVSAELIKPFFARLRPSHHPDFKDLVDLVNDRRGGRFGFISNHAANGFGIALFTSLLFRYRYYTLTIYTWVLITAYSRIYLGVHFITDIIGGFIWGTLAGGSVYFLYLYIRRRFFRIPQEQLVQSPLTINSIHLLMSGILLTVIYIIVCALFFPIVE